MSDKHVPERWILIGTGEGASASVVTDLKQGLHDFMCCCGQSLDVCQDETVLWVLMDMNEAEGAWALDEENSRLQYSADLECSQITITRLDELPELTAAEQRIQELETEVAELKKGYPDENDPLLNRIVFSGTFDPAVRKDHAGGTIGDWRRRALIAEEAYVSATMNQRNSLSWNDDFSDAEIELIKQGAIQPQQKGSK